MNTKLTLFFFGVLILSSCAQVQSKQYRSTSNYPPYQEVVTHVLETYHFDYNPEFRKTEAGYEVSILDANTRQFGAPLLVWSAKTQAYLSLDLEPVGADKGSGALASMLRADLGYYDLHPYYGYPQWATDAIAYWEANPPITADAWYSKGEAYRHRATNRVHLHFSHVDSTLWYPAEPGEQNPWSSRQIQSYEADCAAAAAAFQEALAIDSSYSERPLADRLGFFGAEMYHEMRPLVGESKARAYIKPYPLTAFQRRMAYEQLSACEPQALLFVWSDADYFPLLYLQAQEGFRTDVTVVTAQYLGFDLYLADLLTQPRFGKAPLSVSLSAEVLGAQPKFILNRPYSSYGTAITIAELVSAINDPAKRAEEAWEGLPHYLKLPKGPLMLQWPEGATSTLNVLKYTLDKGDYVLLDLLQQYVGKRPIHITGGIVYELGISNNMVSRGPLSSLVAQSYPAFEEELNWQYIDSLPPHTLPKWSVEARRYQLYRLHVPFQELLNHYFETDQIDKMGEVLDRYLEVFPVDRVPLTLFGVAFLNYAYMVNEAQGDQWLQLLVKDLQTAQREGTMSPDELEYQVDMVKVVLERFRPEKLSVLKVFR